jgi:hypothetical protein
MATPPRQFGEAIFILVPHQRKSYRVHKLSIPERFTNTTLLLSLRSILEAQVSYRDGLRERIWRMVMMQRLAFGKAQVLGVSEAYVP